MLVLNKTTKCVLDFFFFWCECFSLLTKFPGREETWTAVARRCLEDKTTNPDHLPALPHNGELSTSHLSVHCLLCVKV